MAVSAAFSEKATAALTGLATRFSTHPGSLIKNGEFDEVMDSIPVHAVLNSLSNGFTSRAIEAGVSGPVVFVGAMMLGLKTECATDSYGIRIDECADSFNIPWLRQFNQTWKTDEYTHHTGYKLGLLRMGFSEAELDREIAESRAKVFVHRGLSTPWGVTVFGTVQEYLTGYFHRLIANLLQEAAPHAAGGIRRIEAREWVHTRYYRDMTVILIEDRPDILPDVLQALVRFELPGNQVATELQEQASKWLPVLGADFHVMSGDLTAMLHSFTRDVRTTGQLAIELAATKGYGTGWITPARVLAAVNLLGGRGRGILGEAVLAKYLPWSKSNLFDGKAMLDEALTPHNFAEPVRRLLRNWIMGFLPDNIAELG